MNKETYQEIQGTLKYLAELDLNDFNSEVNREIATAIIKLLVTIAQDLDGIEDTLESLRNTVATYIDEK